MKVRKVLRIVLWLEGVGSSVRCTVEAWAVLGYLCWSCCWSSRISLALFYFYRVVQSAELPRITERNWACCRFMLQ